MQSEENEKVNTMESRENNVRKRGLQISCTLLQPFNIKKLMYKKAFY